MQYAICTRHVGEAEGKCAAAMQATENVRRATAHPVAARLFSANTCSSTCSKQSSTTCSVSAQHAAKLRQCMIKQPINM
jgi:hypothetical protein